MITRIDFAGALSSPRALPNGHKRFEARATTTAPMTYVDNGGSWQEQRGPIEQRRIARDLVGCPVTMDHPRAFMFGDEPSDGWDSIAGVVTDTRMDGDDVVAGLEIWHPIALGRIADGSYRDVSLGYGCETVPTGHADVLEQRNVQPDHLALVTVGRCQDAGRGKCTIKRDRHDDCKCAGSCACAGKGTRRMGTRRMDTTERTARDAMIARSKNAWQHADGIGRTREQAFAAHATDPQSTNVVGPARTQQVVSGAAAGRTREQALASPDPNDLAARSAREPIGFATAERATTPTGADPLVDEPTTDENEARRRMHRASADAWKTRTK